MMTTDAIRRRLADLQLHPGPCTPNAFLLLQQIPLEAQQIVPLQLLERMLTCIAVGDVAGDVLVRGEVDELMVLFVLLVLQERGLRDRDIWADVRPGFDESLLREAAQRCQIRFDRSLRLDWQAGQGRAWALVVSADAADWQSVSPGGLVFPGAPSPHGLEPMVSIPGAFRVAFAKNDEAERAQQRLEIADLSVSTFNHDRLAHLSETLAERTAFATEWRRMFCEPTRMDFLNHCLASRDLRDYLEIGVNNPESCFDNIQTPRKWSVDPGLEYAPNPVDFPMTSDAFFEALAAGKLDCDRLPLPADRRFDLVFIDGLHRAEQAWRDIEHALDHLRPGGIIVVHDCLPPNEHCAMDVFPHSPSAVTSNYWQGSTWRAFERYCQLGAHHAYVVDADSGMGVIDSAQPAGRRPAPNPFLVLANYAPDLRDAGLLKTFDEGCEEIRASA